MKTDGASGAGGRKKRIKIKIVVLSALLLLFASAFDVRLRTKHYGITTDKVTETVRIALITDLHSCRYGKDQKNLIDAVDDQKPDLVLLGGDICDDVIPDDNAELVLEGLAGRYPCCYVTGNHEYWSGRVDDMLELFRTYGVTILDGSFETIELNGQRITVCGITDPDAALYTDGGLDTRTQLNAIFEPDPHDEDDCTLLLSHRPELIGMYLQYDFDLILAGHAHGGQWRLPGLINGVYAPDQGWFPRYAGGMYVIDDQVMVVSRGLARESTKIPRIFNRPELVIVTLKPPA